MFGFGNKKKFVKKARPQSKPKAVPMKTVATRPIKTKTVKPIVKTATATQTKTVKSTKPKIRAGEFANINSRSAHGHLGIVTKRQKNGRIDAFTTTHSEKYPKHKKIRLEENPNKNDARTSYLNKRFHRVTDNDIGTRRPDIRIKNPIDKSKLRKLKTEAKRDKSK